MELQTYAHEGGEDILREKNVIAEVHELPRIWREHSGQHAHDDRVAAASGIGNWVLQKQIDLGAH